MTIGGDQASDADLILAHRLADIATTVAMDSFGRAVRQEVKHDGSLVTEVDLAVEEGLLFSTMGVSVESRDQADHDVLPRVSVRLITDRRSLTTPMRRSTNEFPGTRLNRKAPH